MTARTGGHVLPVLTVIITVKMKNNKNNDNNKTRFQTKTRTSVNVIGYSLVTWFIFELYVSGLIIHFKVY